MELMSRCGKENAFCIAFRHVLPRCYSVVYRRFTGCGEIKLLYRSRPHLGDICHQLLATR